MSKKLNLTKELFVASGGERDVYQHPIDSTKLIKVLSKDLVGNRNQNDLDYKYFKFLEKKKIQFTHIPKCYDYLDTNLGKGLVVDKVCDYNGNISISFLDVVMKELFFIDTQNKLVEDLRTYLFNNNILFIDIGLYNVLCCEYEEGKYRLVIIDGLGGRRAGVKFWLYLNSKIFTKYKIKKSWNRFLKEIDRKRRQAKELGAI